MYFQGSAFFFLWRKQLRLRVSLTHPEQAAVDLLCPLQANCALYMCKRHAASRPFVFPSGHVVQCPATSVSTLG